MKFRFSNIALIVLIIVLSSRFVFLELDAPANNISGITTWDEPYYSYSAVYDLVKAKSTFPTELEGNAINEIYSLHNKTITKLGFFLFGNTLMGLRFGAVIISLFTLIILFIISRTYLSYSISGWNIKGLFAALFLLTEPYYFMFSRAQTPQIYSIFWITLLLLMVHLYTTKGKAIYITMAAAVGLLMVVFVYPYTAYVALSLGVFIAIECFKSKSLKLFYYAFIGVLLGLTYYVIVLKLNGFYLDDYLHFMKSFRQFRNESDLSNRTPLSILLAPLQILYTNLLRYNPLYILIYFLIPFVFINKIKLNKFEMFLIIVLFVALIQTIGISSYPFKKWVTLFPVLFLSIPIGYKLINTGFFKVLKIRVLFYLGFVFLIFKVSWVVNNPTFWSGFNDNFLYVDPGIILKFLPLLFSIILVVLIEMSIRDKKYIKYLVICTLTYNMSMLVRLNFIDQTSTYVGFLKKYESLFNEKIIMSDSEIYTFYNSGVFFYNYLSPNLRIDSSIVKRGDDYKGRERVYIKSILPYHLINDSIKYRSVNYKLHSVYRGKIYGFAVYNEQ